MGKLSKWFVTELVERDLQYLKSLQGGKTVDYVFKNAIVHLIAMKPQLFNIQAIFENIKEHDDSLRKLTILVFSLSSFCRFWE